MRVLDLFSGIGGFSLGLERAGMQTVAFCEIDPFCQKVLKKHWPDVPIYDDVRNLDYDGAVDVICGGFPCQDISSAGYAHGVRKGIDGGERSGLWKFQLNLIKKHKPKYAIIENVANLWPDQLEIVLKDLMSIGYDAEWHIFPASRIGLLQRRKRAWIIAYPSGKRTQRLLKSGAFSKIRQRRQSCQKDLQEIYENPFKKGESWPKPLIRGMAKRFPDWSHRIKALGNSVVPQIPEIIGHAIMDAEKHNIGVRSDEPTNHDRTR